MHPEFRLKNILDIKGKPKIKKKKQKNENLKRDKD